MALTSCLPLNCGYLACKSAQPAGAAALAEVGAHTAANRNATSAALRKPEITAECRGRASVENCLCICFSFDVVMATPCSKFEGSLRALGGFGLVPGRTKSWMVRCQNLGRRCGIYGRSAPGTRKAWTMTFNRPQLMWSLRP